MILQRHYYGPHYFLIGIFVCMMVASCAPPKAPVTRSPEATRAAQATEVATRVAEFQNAVISAHGAKLIPTEDARTIVTWTVSTLQALRVAPDGWHQTALVTWRKVSPLVEKQDALLLWVAVVDGLLGVAP